jgi:hypothetical protein
MAANCTLYDPLEMAHRKPAAGSTAAARDGRATPRPERAALVGLISAAVRRIDAEQSLEELAGLAEAAGASVVLRMMQERPKPDAGTFIGQGGEPRRRVR